MVKEKSKYDPPTLTKWHLNIHSVQWTPPYDVFEDAESYLVRVEIAGTREEDFLIWMEGDTLIITGERHAADISNIVHGEIIYGEFKARIGLSESVISSEVEASYQNGFLTVYLPKL
jgi:HSP20 family protein